MRKKNYYTSLWMLRSQMSPAEKQEEKNAEFWRHINALREQSSDKIEVIQGIVKDPFVGKYCTNAEIQCDSLDTKKAVEAILTTYLN